MICVKLLKSRPELSNETRFHPCKAAEEERFVVSPDSGSKIVMVVAVQKNRAHGAKRRNGKQLELLRLSRDLYD
jgi:hypothetical protein